jgi:CheY-like chemotaxis protein
LKGRVLVADDEEDLRELYSQALLDVGYEVDVAPDAKTALAQVAQSAFDLVVSDIVMPGLDGISFLKAIHDRDPDLPVILVTGQPTIESVMRAMEYGAIQYLVKPVALDQLVKAVERGLGLRKIAKVRREASNYLGQAGRSVDDGSGLSQSLTSALASIWMAYQPIVQASDGQVYGYEALLRSNEPSLPHPGAVFDAAEKLGRVSEVGRAVRRSVAASLDLLRCPVFVNIHPLDLADEVLLSLDDPLAPRASDVVLEITERASLEGMLRPTNKSSAALTRDRMCGLFGNALMSLPMTLAIRGQAVSRARRPATYVSGYAQMPSIASNSHARRRRRMKGRTDPYMVAPCSLCTPGIPKTVGWYTGMPPSMT